MNYFKILILLFTPYVFSKHHHHNSTKKRVHHYRRIKNERPLFQNIPGTYLAQNVSDIKNLPYMTGIYIYKNLWCSGAIVDVTWVLTAAHCLNYVLHVSTTKSLPDFVTVRMGSARSSSSKEVPVLSVVRHPKYEEEPVPHADVALLRLEHKIIFNAFTNLIKIYDGMKEPYAQSFVTIAGWGSRKASDTAFTDPQPNLLSARLKVRSQRFCSDAYQLVNGFTFTDDFFCASLRRGTREGCLFDAGSPAVQRNLLMGVLSFGPENCGDEVQPNVFVKAYYFRDFVMHTIKSYKSDADMIEAMMEMNPELSKDALMFNFKHTDMDQEKEAEGDVQNMK